MELESVMLSEINHTEKPVNNLKEKKIAKMELEPKSVHIPNSPWKPSEKDSVVPPELQNIPADPKMKTLSEIKKKTSLIALMVVGNDAE